MLKKLTVAGLGAAAVLVAAAGPASAGEVTGNGKPTPIRQQANSICAFSGQNDAPGDPFPEGGRVQSYGQLVKQGLRDAIPVNPGDTCRGGSNVPEP